MSCLRRGSCKFRPLEVFCTLCIGGQRQAVRVMSTAQRMCEAPAQADKRWQLADWRVRPLSAEALLYARMDTHYLLYIYDRLRVGPALFSAAWPCLHARQHVGTPCAVVPRSIPCTSCSASMTGSRWGCMCRCLVCALARQGHLAVAGAGPGPQSGTQCTQHGANALSWLHLFWWG